MQAGQGRYAWFRSSVMRVSRQKGGTRMNPPPAAEGELDMAHLRHALWRRKWSILIPTLLVALVSGIGVNLLTPKYKSEARVLIENRENIFLRPEAEKATERTARVRSLAERLVAAGSHAGDARHHQGSSPYDAGGARPGSLLRAAECLSGRKISGDFHRISVRRSGACGERRDCDFAGLSGSAADRQAGSDARRRAM